ncbi:MAG: tetratricopeptide repeat protein, partial [Phycisphaerae bacterium]
LASQKEYGEAIRHYQAALKIEPDSVRVLGNLANALASSGRSAEAIDHYRRALSLHPRYADAHYNLGLVLQRHGNLAESIEHYQQAVRIRPDYAAAHNRLAAALIESGHIGDAFSHYREAVRLKPDWPAPMNDLAWILATHPDPEVRQPDEAIRLAEYAAELTRHRNMNVLDTLAAAFAAAGRYDQAVSTAGRALAVATNAASGPIVNQIEKRLDLYRRGRAYHESPGKEHRRSSIVLGD